MDKDGTSVKFSVVHSSPFRDSIEQDQFHSKYRETEISDPFLKVIADGSIISCSSNSADCSDFILNRVPCEAIPASSLVPEDSTIMERVLLDSNGRNESVFHDATTDNNLPMVPPSTKTSPLLQISHVAADNPQQGENEEYFAHHSQLINVIDHEGYKVIHAPFREAKSSSEVRNLDNGENCASCKNQELSQEIKRIALDDERRVSSQKKTQDFTATNRESEAEVLLRSKSPQENRPDFSIGDHVYQWCSFAGVPFMYQHHGIVLDIYFCTVENYWILKIVDFSNRELDSDRSFQSDFDKCESVECPKPRFTRDNVTKKSLLQSKCPHGGCIRVYETIVGDDTTTTGANLWRKVEYNATWWKRNSSRAGTCTSSACDAPGLVRARAQFLIDHVSSLDGSVGNAHSTKANCKSDLLPPYSATYSNSECVAVWCKTGTWCTLQASSWLYGTVASQAKQAATLAGIASAATVTVPSAGIWGWLGYTTTVSLASTQPLLLPAIAAYGVVTTAGPALLLLRAKSQWKILTEALNSAFWEDAINHPEIFVDCITYWSGL